MCLPLPLHVLRHRTRETLPTPCMCTTNTAYRVDMQTYTASTAYRCENARMGAFSTSFIWRTQTSYAVRNYLATLHVRVQCVRICSVMWLPHAQPLLCINVQSTKHNNNSARAFLVIGGVESVWQSSCQFAVLPRPICVDVIQSSHQPYPQNVFHRQNYSTSNTRRYFSAQHRIIYSLVELNNKNSNNNGK